MRVIGTREQLLHARELSDRSAVPVVIAAIFYAVFVALKLHAHKFDASEFVTAGDRVCDRAGLPTNVRLSKDSWGYDGQYYYRLALNPLTSSEREFGVGFDNPVYRQQRIFFPFLVWLSCGGSPRFVCWAMLAVNYLGLCALAWLSARYVRQIGRHSLWGLVFALYPGLVLTLARDLTEIWSAALIMAALAAARRQQWPVASVWLTVAAFARETTVALTVGMLLAAFSTSRPSRLASDKRVRSLIVPLIAFAAWQLALRWWWHKSVPPPGLPSFAPPLLGFTSCLAKSLVSPDPALTYAELSFIGIACGAAALSLTHCVAPRHERLPFILYVTLAAMLGPNMWADDWGFLRMLYEVIFMAFVVLLQSQPKPLYLTTAYSAALWGYLFATRWQ